MLVASPSLANMRRMNARFGGLIGLFVAFTVNYLLRSSTREAAVYGGLHVVEYSGAWKGLVRLLWVFPVVIAIVAIVSPPRADEWWIPLAVIGGFSAIHVPLTFEVMKRRIEIAQSGITVKSAWHEPVGIAWLELASVGRKANELEIRTTRGKVVRVSSWLSGTGTLTDELERRVAKAPGKRLPGVSSRR